MSNKKRGRKRKKLNTQRLKEQLKEDIVCAAVLDGGGTLLYLEDLGEHEIRLHIIDDKDDE